MTDEFNDPEAAHGAAHGEGEPPDGNGRIGSGLPEHTEGGVRSDCDRSVWRDVLAAALGGLAAGIIVLFVGAAIDDTPETLREVSDKLDAVALTVRRQNYGPTVAPLDLAIDDDDQLLAEAREKVDRANQHFDDQETVEAASIYTEVRPTIITLCEKVLSEGGIDDPSFEVRLAEGCGILQVDIQVGGDL